MQDQAGMSLHQAAHPIDCGLGAAAASISAFCAFAVVATDSACWLVGRIGVRLPLALRGCLLVGVGLVTADGGSSKKT
jgi:hypothetical protein